MSRGSCMEKLRDLKAQIAAKKLAMAEFLGWSTGPGLVENSIKAMHRTKVGWPAKYIKQHVSSKTFAITTDIFLRKPSCEGSINPTKSQATWVLLLLSGVSSWQLWVASIKMIPSNPNQTWSKLAKDMMYSCRLILYYEFMWCSGSELGAWLRKTAAEVAASTSAGSKLGRGPLLIP